MGLATEVVEPDQLDHWVDVAIQDLLEKAPLTLWATKEQMRRLTHRGMPDDSDVVAEVYASADFVEGRQAFGEKRPPMWEGR